MNEIAEQSGLPVPEATVGWSYGQGLATLKKYFLEVLLITLVVMVLSAPFGWAKAVQDRASDWDSGVNVIIQMFALGFGVLILGPVKYGANYAMLKAVRGEKPEFLDIFVFQKNYLNVVLAHLLTNAIIAVGFVFLIVPGIIFACKLAFVPYLVTDRKMEATEAIRESWRMTTGHSGTIFLMGLLVLPLFIAGALLLGIGIILAIMWISLAFAAIFAAVEAKKTVAENV
jgi:uncharacterized membrane protein